MLPGVNPRLSLNGLSKTEYVKPRNPVLPGVNPRLSLNERGHDLVRGDPHVLPGVNPRLSLNAAGD